MRSVCKCYECRDDCSLVIYNENMIQKDINAAICAPHSPKNYSLILVINVLLNVVKY